MVGLLFAPGEGEPLPAGSCRVTGNTGIDDADLVPLGLKRHLKPDWERFAGFDAIAGGKTISEGDDRNRA